MNDQQKINLRAHLFQIASSFISDLSETNTILSLDERDMVVPEAVCNHYLIDLLSQMSPAIFIHYCEAIFNWLADPKNGYSGHPFTLDSYTLFCARNEENKNIFEERIGKYQEGDGAIPVYTAFVEGGDFFSTLWATKILIQYDAEQFKDRIHKSLDYLIGKHAISARSVAQIGYLLYLMLLFKPDDYSEKIASFAPIVQEAAKNTNFDQHLVDHVNDVFLIEDLLQFFIWNQSEEARVIVEEKLIALFELDEEPKLPGFFKKWRSFKPQQPYYRMLLKAGVLAAKYLKVIDCPLPTIELNSYLHGTYRHIKYLGMRADRELKRYKAQYDSIEADFSRYEDALKIMWEQSESDYDTSVFLMMPFKRDMEYRVLTDEIKKVCKEKGFTAFRVDDPFRSPYDGLWDNIVTNMLGCKYGISVYVSEKVHDALEDEPRFFHNPNVAIEYGFMKSRGKKVLILKDKKSKTPSDIQGFVWRPFELKNPDKTVAPVLGPWLDEQKTVNKAMNRDEE